MPDDKRLGILWISIRDLEAAFDMTGTFNSVTLKLGCGSNPAEVTGDIDRLLEPFGSVGADLRDEQILHQYLSDEIASLPVLRFGCTVATVAKLLQCGVASKLGHAVHFRTNAKYYRCPNS